MYVDETVLNFMNRREYESSLMVNETIEASVAFHRYLQLHDDLRNATAGYGRQTAQ